MYFHREGVIKIMPSFFVHWLGSRTCCWGGHYQMALDYNGPLCLG